MTKVSDTTREHILAVGLKLVQQNGLRALTVRGLAKEAQVNLGSFVYHFKNRESFINELVCNWYQTLLTKLEISIDHTLSAQENIYQVIQQVTQFMIQHRSLISMLAKDALFGERAIQEFIQTTLPNHVFLMLGLIDQGKAQEEIIDEPSIELLLFIAGAVGLPILLQELFLHNKNIQAHNATPAVLGLRQQLIDFSLDPISIEKRATWALSAITTKDA